MLSRLQRSHYAVVLSVLLHVGVIGFLVVWPTVSFHKPVPEVPEVVMIELPLPEPLPVEEASFEDASTDDLWLPEPPAPAPTNTPSRAYMDAPPAPSAEEWAQASSYRLKNSKRYRYTWSQQVRSMMGTAFEGPDQGSVRFEIEIAPDGSLTRLETLWSTSPKAEALARAAVANMPPLPPTPTGQPLVFRKTISFQPFATDVPPLYKDDCLPDPPRFRNPYAWDGKSAQGPAVQPTAEKFDPEAYEECLKQLPEDSIEAEAADDRRQLERWRSPHLGN
jgi:TonB family protein